MTATRFDVVFGSLKEDAPAFLTRDVPDLCEFGSDDTHRRAHREPTERRARLQITVRDVVDHDPHPARVYRAPPTIIGYLGELS